MKRQFFSGNSLEQAVMLAARQFGLEPEQVAFHVREKKHGFIKIRRRVVIEVDREAPEVCPSKRPSLLASESVLSTESSVSPERRSSKMLTASEYIPVSKTASTERAVLEILRFLRINAEISVEHRKDCFEVEIHAPDSDSLFDQEGLVLQALEDLVPRVVRTWLGQGVPVRVDCGGFRKDMEQEVRNLAMEVADKVRQDGISQYLEPMSPADRRIVHLTLAEDPDVATESEGRGFFRRVRVSTTGSMPERVNESIV